MKEARDTKERCTAEFLYRIADKSFQMEMDRYESLTKMASWQIVCISVISVAILTLIDMVAGVYVDTGHEFLLVVSCSVTFTPLLASLIFSILAQHRFKYRALAGSRAFSDNVRNE